MQDQLVPTYVAADYQTILGQSKIALALGLKDQAAALAAAAQTLNTGATQSSDTRKQADQAYTDNQADINERLKSSDALSDEFKPIFADGLAHLGLGVVATVKLKDAAINFQKTSEAQIRSASVMDNMSLPKKLARGMYVAVTLAFPHCSGDSSRVTTDLSSAVSFAQSHGIPVPSDATTALSAGP